MLIPSAAPRWNRQMRIFPFRAPCSSAANVARRRKLGLNPSVTSASAPSRTKTLRCITISSALLALEFGTAERETDHLRESAQLRETLEAALAATSSSQPPGAAHRLRCWFGLHHGRVSGRAFHERIVSTDQDLPCLWRSPAGQERF